MLEETRTPVISAMSLKKKISLWLGVFILIQIAFAILRSVLSTLDYMKVLRIHHLANLEFFMTLASFMSFNRVSELVRKFSGKVFVKSGLLLILLAGQCCFIAHYMLAGEDPNWLAMFSLISSSIGVHLTAFYIGFGILELIGKYFKVEENNSITLFFLFSKPFHTIVGLSFAIGFTLAGLHATSLPTTIVKVEIPIRTLPQSMDGFRIALLTDIHVGPSVGAKRLRRLVQITNSLNPDAIAISGDLVDGSLKQLIKAVQPLKDLKSKHGTYYATGNHEYYHGNPNEWFEYFEGIGVHPLHNSHVKLKTGNFSYICLAGVDDVSAGKSGVPGHGMDLKKALRGCEDQLPMILISHQPNAVAKLLKDPSGQLVDLFLSGHTHGGQFYMLVPFAYLTNSYYLGLYELENHAKVYVSAGVHFWGPPVKMYGFSEITDITLRTMMD